MVVDCVLVVVNVGVGVIDWVFLIGGLLLILCVCCIFEVWFGVEVIMSGGELILIVYGFVLIGEEDDILVWLV